MHKVGDRVRVDCPNNMHHGEECTVLADARFNTRINFQRVLSPAAWIYEVNILSLATPGTNCAYTATELIPIYDGNEKTEWEDCIWKPETETVQ